MIRHDNELVQAKTLLRAVLVEHLQKEISGAVRLQSVFLFPG
jgi:hypothetical protein